MTYTAGVDERVKCTVAVVGPGDCERQFRFGPNFDAFMDKVRRAMTDFVLTGVPTFIVGPAQIIGAQAPDVFVSMLKRVAERGLA